MGPRKLLSGLLVAIIAIAGCASEATCKDSAVTDSGVRFQDLECGDGVRASRGNTVAVEYTGTLEDGTIFDSSEGEPFRFVLGAGQVIGGWDEGIPGMKIGGLRRLTVPPDLGYGDAGYPPASIPPNAALIFEIELLEVSD